MIVSCSQSERKVKLEVSTSFIYSNNSKGGLVIKGVRTQGGQFIASTSSSSSLSVSLLDGNWTFHAVAWDSTTTGDTFGGNISCGKSVTKLDASTTGISLSISSANCNDPDFTDSLSMFETSAVGLKQLGIYSCSKLIDSSNSVYTANSTDLSQCTGVTADQIARARSARITIPNFQAGVATIGLTKCFNANVTNQIIELGRFPVATIPVRITLFKEKDCEDEGTPFYFSKGISAGVESEFDSILNLSASLPSGVAGKATLILPFNYGKRGRSTTSGLLPAFNCGTATNPQPCLPAPTSQSGVDFVFDRYGSNVRIDNSSSFFSCTNGSVTNPPTDNDITFENCRCDSDTDIVCRVRMTDSSSGICDYQPAAGSTPAYLGCSASIAGATKIFQSISNGTYPAYNFLYASLPANLSSSTIKDSLDAFIWDKEGLSILSDARSMLGFGGQVSVFSKFITTNTNISCDDLSGEKSIVIVAGFGFKTFNIIAKESPKKIPAAFCGTNDNQCPDGVGETYFDKRIITRELINQQLITNDVLDFNCTNRVGHLESQISEQENGESTDEKSLLIWNTEDHNNSLVEQYSIESSSGGAHPRDHKKIIRVRRDEDNSSNARVTIESLQENTHHFTDPNDIDFKNQSLEHSEFIISNANSNNIIHESMNIFGTFAANSSWNIHSIPYAEKLKRMPLTPSAYVSPSGAVFAGITHFDADQITNSSTIYSAAIWRDRNNGSLQIRYSKNNSFIHGELSAPGSGWEYLLPKISVNQNGNFVISYIKRDTLGNTSSLYIQRYFPIISTMTLGGMTASTLNINPDAHDIQVLNSEEIVISYSDSSSIKFLKGTVSGGSFVIDTPTSAVQVFDLSGNAQEIVPDSLRLTLHDEDKFLFTWGQEIQLINPVSNITYSLGNIINLNGILKKCIAFPCTLPPAASLNDEVQYDASIWQTITPIKGIGYRLASITSTGPLSVSSPAALSTISISSGNRPIELEVTPTTDKTYLTYATDQEPGDKYIKEMSSTATTFSSSNSTLKLNQNMNSVCADSTTFGSIGTCTDRKRAAPGALSKQILPSIQSLRNQVLDPVFTESEDFVDSN